MYPTLYLDNCILPSKAHDTFRAILSQLVSPLSQDFSTRPAGSYYGDEMHRRLSLSLKEQRRMVKKGIKVLSLHTLFEDSQVHVTCGLALRSDYGWLGRITSLLTVQNCVLGGSLPAMSSQTMVIAAIKKG